MCGKTEPAIIGFNSLPLGAVGSVAGFLRISHAVWFIGTAALGLWWSAYFGRIIEQQFLGGRDPVHSSWLTVRNWWEEAVAFFGGVQNAWTDFGFK